MSAISSTARTEQLESGEALKASQFRTAQESRSTIPR
jgi:hypothetical protein